MTSTLGAVIALGSVIGLTGLTGLMVCVPTIGLGYITYKIFTIS